MLRTAILTLSAVSLLGWFGPSLDIDDHSTDRDQASALEHLHREYARQQRFERAAQSMCGPQSPWVEVSPGVVQCLTRYGKPAGRKTRITQGAL